jgi:hypothetical protein
LYFDKTAELPVFNLMKLHGSLSWQMEGSDSVRFSVTLQQIKDVAAKLLDADHLIDIPGNATIATLVPTLAGKKADAATDEFMDAYEKLLIIVNPTKDKFKHTLMNRTYYELLRLYSNELEKENTVLFAMGFSFADEHIREITVRAANSNPTLMVYVIAHTSEAKAQIEGAMEANTIRNSNIQVLGPDQEDDGHGHMIDKFKYDFSTINEKLFSAVLARCGEL